jgi:hypothetical protein
MSLPETTHLKYQDMGDTRLESYKCGGEAGNDLILTVLPTRERP